MPGKSGLREGEGESAFHPMQCVLGKTQRCWGLSVWPCGAEGPGAGVLLAQKSPLFRCGKVPIPLADTVVSHVLGLLGSAQVKS